MGLSALWGRLRQADHPDRQSNWRYGSRFWGQSTAQSSHTCPHHWIHTEEKGDPFLPPEMLKPSLGTQTVEVSLSGGRAWAGGGGWLFQLQPSLGLVFYTVSNISSEKVSGLVLLLGRLRCREGRCYIEGPGQWGINIVRLAAVGPLEPRGPKWAWPIFIRCGQEVA